MSKSNAKQIPILPLDVSAEPVFSAGYVFEQVAAQSGYKCIQMEIGGPDGQSFQVNAFVHYSELVKAGLSKE